MSDYIISIKLSCITSFITQQLRGIRDPTLVVNNSHQETADMSDDSVTKAVVRKNKIQRTLLLLLLSSHM